MKFIITIVIALMTSSIFAVAFAKKENKFPLNLPYLGLGTVELGRHWGIGESNSKAPTEARAKQVLKTAYDKGWRLVDTASSYQASEEIIGKYLPKSQYHYLLITKPGEHSILNSDSQCRVRGQNNYCLQPAARYDFSRTAIFRDVSESLKKLKVKKIDIVLLHLQNETAMDILNKGEAWKALQDLKKQNLVDYIGVSVNGPAAERAINLKGIAVLETEYNLLNQTNAKAIEMAHKKGLAVIVRGGLGTGLLTEYVKLHLNDPNLPYIPQVKALLTLTQNNYDLLTQLALAFLKQNKFITSMILGADTPEFIDKDNYLIHAKIDQQVVDEAIRLMKKFPTPSLYTESVGTFYFKE